MAAECHRRIHFVVEDFQATAYAVFAVGTETVEEGFADHRAFGAQCHALQDVLSARDAAIQPHFDFAADGSDDFRQHFDAGQCAVKLAAAVVGNYQRIGAGSGSLFRVFSGHDALDDEFAAPEVLDAGNIVPAKARVELFAGPGRKRGQVGYVLGVADDVAEGAALGVQHAPAPLRLGGEVDHVCQGRLRRRGKAVFNVAVALAEHLQIGSEHQRRTICRFRPLDEVFHEFAVAHHIKLEPERLACVRRHVFNRADGHGGKREGNTELLGGFRREDLTIGVHHAGKTGRGDDDRHTHLLANHRRFQGAAGHIDQHALAELDRVKITAVVVQGAFRPGTGTDVIEKHTRHLAFGDAAQVFNASHFAEIAGHRFSCEFNKLERGYKYGQSIVFINYHLRKVTGYAGEIA